jgi:hypothetical protein
MFRESPTQVVVIASGIVLSVFLTAADAATVAYWQFEPGALEVDSVGGNTLSNSGVTSSGDKSSMAPGTGSALFDGSQSIFSTVQTLDLSAYSDLTIEYFIKTSQTALAVVLEHFGAGGTSAPGVIGSAINDLGGAYVVEGYQRTTSDTYATNTTSPVLQDGGWHHVAITIDGSETGSDRIKLFVDAAEIGVATLSASVTAPFLNETLYIGSRGNAELKFAGLLDELRISDAILSPDEFLIIIPEPGTLLLAVVGLAAGLHRRRRQHHQRSPG